MDSFYLAYDFFLTNYLLWGFIAASVLVLRLAHVNGVASRNAVFAVVNVAFFGVFLGFQTVYLLIGLSGYHFALKYAASTRYSSWVLVAGIVLLVALFIVNKTTTSYDSTFFTIASVIGFSYVALRLIDMSSLVLLNDMPVVSFAQFVNYVTPFHMLSAGPIQGYEEFVDSQSKESEKLDIKNTVEIADLLATGLFKKFVLAALISQYLLKDFQTEGLYLILELNFFYLWLYLDFSAYTDIALAIGRLMGIQTPENFNKPYVAKNIVDFWERWHITLSLFIRRNLFIPIYHKLLHGRLAAFPLVCVSIAFLVAFALCGVWHDFTWSFFLWGVYHGVGLVGYTLYRNLLKKRLGKKRMKLLNKNPWYHAVSVVLTFEFVALSMIFLV